MTRLRRVVYTKGAGALVVFLFGCTLAEHVGSLPEYKGQLRANEEIATVTTRRGVTVRVLLVTPDQTNASVKGIFLVFPGGEGFLVKDDVLYRMFTVELAGRGFAVAVVDVPADQAGGMSGSNELFRVSDRHADDIRGIVDFVSRKWQAPVFLLGHSLGSASAAHVASSLNDTRIRGLVMTAS